MAFIRILDPAGNIVTTFHSDVCPAVGDYVGDYTRGGGQFVGLRVVTVEHLVESDGDVAPKIAIRTEAVLSEKYPFHS